LNHIEPYLNFCNPVGGTRTWYYISIFSSSNISEMSDSSSNVSETSEYWSETPKRTLFHRSDCPCDRCLDDSSHDYINWDDTDSDNEDTDNENDSTRSTNEVVAYIHNRYGVWEVDKTILELLEHQDVTGKVSTGLIKAVQLGYKEVKDWLTRKGHELGEHVKTGDCAEVMSNIVNERGREGRSALHYAALSGDERTAKLLLLLNADTEARTSDGVTPLHVAALYNHVDVMRVMIANNADVHAKDLGRRTPLLDAMAHDGVTIGASVEVNGKQRKQQDVTMESVVLLLKSGAGSDIFAPTLYSRNAYHYRGKGKKLKEILDAYAAKHAAMLEMDKNAT
jgi:hypothetical protein